MTNTRRCLARCAVALLVPVWFGACALGPAASPAPADYDLGPLRARSGGEPRAAVTLLLPDASAPAWLNGTGIVYRLGYESASRTQTYAMSRWVAPPPAMLSERLRSRFAAMVRGVIARPDGVRADYLLRVELIDFSQTFSTPGSSNVVLRARASLVNLADRSLAAQREFVLERPAQSADARGAVGALGAASEEFVESLLGWTLERLAAAGQK